MCHLRRIYCLSVLGVVVVVVVAALFVVVVVVVDGTAAFPFN